MVKISEVTHPSGMPAMDETIINFGTIALTLNRQDYLALAEAISEKAASDVIAAQRVYDKHYERVKATSELVQDVRRIFFEGEDLDDIFVMREISEVNEEQLRDVLDKNNRLLGFE